MNSQNKWLFFRYYLRSRQFSFIILLIFYVILFAFSLLYDDAQAVLYYVMLMLCLLSMIGLVFDIVKHYQNFRRAALYGEGQADTPLEALLFSKRLKRKNRPKCVR